MGKQGQSRGERRDGGKVVSMGLTQERLGQGTQQGVYIHHELLVLRGKIKSSSKVLARGGGRRMDMNPAQSRESLSSSDSRAAKPQ